MDQRPFAAASFEEQDAGSGPVHASPTLGPMTPALHNISARHVHDVAATLPDDRQFLRSWRRQLQEVLTSQNARLVRFLVADMSGASLADSDVARRCTDVLTKYSRPTWNFASSTRDLSLSLSTEEAERAITTEIGIEPAALREHMKRTVRAYVNTAAGLCAAETRLEEKLRRLETISARIHDLMFLEPTVELEEMGAATRRYLDSVLAKVDLEEEYEDLVDHHTRFALLRNLVSLGHFQRTAAPTCTICMTKEVSQAVTPCGHTFCDDCCRSQMTACYICRVQIRDKIRLYFS